MLRIANIGKESNWDSHTLLTGVQNGATTLCSYLAVAHRLNTFSNFCNPAIPLSGIYPRAMKAYIYKRIALS